MRGTRSGEGIMSARGIFSFAHSPEHKRPLWVTCQVPVHGALVHLYVHHGPLVAREPGRVAYVPAHGPLRAEHIQPPLSAGNVGVAHHHPEGGT